MLPSMNCMIFCEVARNFDTPVYGLLRLDPWIKDIRTPHSTTMTNTLYGKANLLLAFQIVGCELWTHTQIYELRQENSL